jgi:hypothetical protein
MWLGVVGALTVTVLSLWTTWPDRTAQEFFTLVEAGRFAEADAMVRVPENWTFQTPNEVRILEPSVKEKELTVPDWHSVFRSPQLEMEPPISADWLCGRRRYRATLVANGPPVSDLSALGLPSSMANVTARARYELRIRFRIQCGTIRIQPLEREFIQSTPGALRPD